MGQCPCGTTSKNLESEGDQMSLASGQGELIVNSVCVRHQVLVYASLEKLWHNKGILFLGLVKSLREAVLLLGQMCR